ncbi:MAG: hypothetical protein BVN28_00670 [Nitrospira sp. ST-bin4]|nr:MAG: hypothetical protein BVN28_00670 [Nitrospira sp. ST-bin4]
MDAETYKEAIEYELLTRVVYEAILKQDGVTNVNVQHNVPLKGRSGVEHQIDVFWEFKQAGIPHRVLIECKNYASNLTLEKARNFFAVLHDVGNSIGLMVTKTGFQRGTASFCKYYGIKLKLLRQPTDKDWKGRIKKTIVNITPRFPVSTEENPITAQMYLRPSSKEQEARLNTTAQLNPGLGAVAPSLRFLDANGEPKTEEMRWWIPHHLDVLNYVDGGPYKKCVELKEHFISADLGEGPELIEAIGIVIHFHVETLRSDEFALDAEETVGAILKDFESGEWEHVHPSSS